MGLTLVLILPINAVVQHMTDIASLGAKLPWQAGAALVAMLFHLATDDSAHIALLIAAGFAAAGSAVSFYRIRLPLPAGLNRRR